MAEKITRSKLIIDNAIQDSTGAEKLAIKEAFNTFRDKIVALYLS